MQELQDLLEKEGTDTSNRLVTGMDQDESLISQLDCKGFAYRPFDGHQSRLGHYYRHLWHMMKYIEKHAPTGTDKDYADMVRAQLSNHEQAMLCINSLSRVGSAWVNINGKSGYMIKYKLIKNIPRNFFGFDDKLDLKAEFPDIRFQYEETNGGTEEPNR